MKRVSLFLLSFFFSFFPTIGFSDRSIITSRRIHLREPPAHRPTSFLKRSFFLPWESGRAAPRHAVYSILYVFISLCFIFLSHVLYACNFLYSVSRDGFLNIIFCLFLPFFLSFVFSLSLSPSQLTLFSRMTLRPSGPPAVPSAKHAKNTKSKSRFDKISFAACVCSRIRSSLSFSHSLPYIHTSQTPSDTRYTHTYIWLIYMYIYMFYIYIYTYICNFIVNIISITMSLI